MNKQKDRLVELLQESDKKAQEYILENDHMDWIPKTNELEEVRADYLLANGVIVPPVKVGQSFWHIEEYTHELLPDKYPTVKVVCESKVEKIFIEKYGNSFGDTRKSFSFHDIGKTVFLTEEEAEAKMKEGVQG